MFEVCFKNLFKMLPRAALRNVVFCFTNTRTHDPGDTIPVLRKLLKTVKIDKDVLLSANTYYCTDNEGIRYLAAVECMPHMIDEKRNFLETNRKVIDES